MASEKVAQVYDLLRKNMNMSPNFQQFSCINIDVILYFFSGEHYYIYDVANDRPSYGGLIRTKFAAHNSSSPMIPVNLDSAFYDWRSGVDMIYFFKGDQVCADHRLLTCNRCKLLC